MQVTKPPCSSYPCLELHAAGPRGCRGCGACRWSQQAMLVLEVSHLLDECIPCGDHQVVAVLRMRKIACSLSGMHAWCDAPLEAAISACPCTVHISQTAAARVTIGPIIKDMSSSMPVCGAPDVRGSRHTGSMELLVCMLPLTSAAPTMPLFYPSHASLSSG